MRKDIMPEEKVLIIDDEDIAKEAIAKYIRKEGFDTYLAANGREGLELYHKIQPSLIILDLRMPVMDGIEFLETLKLTVTDPCAVIMLTAHGDDDDLKKCFDNGVCAFLRKPFNIYELTGLVRHTVALKRAERERMEEIQERRNAEEEIERNYQIQSVVNSILRTSSETLSLKEQMEKILDLILSIPWLSIQSKGSIFVSDESKRVLTMTAQRGLAEVLLEKCGKLPYGRCLCGRAAMSQETIFADCIDDRHDVKFDGMMPHGHYCVPILSSNRVLGVINLYVKHGHRRKSSEEEFLTAVANTLAGIIERNRSQYVLREREEQLLSIVQSTTDAIISVDGDGRVVLWNRGAENIFGYREDEIIGETLDIIIPEGVRDTHKNALGSAVSMGRLQNVGRTVEVVAVGKDGREIPIELSLASWKGNGGKMFFTGVLRDISRRKQTEMELKNNIEKLRKTMGGVIQTMALTVEAKDPYTAGHQRRVADLARAIACEMNMDFELVDGIRMAGVVHDIGKIYVPSEILSKPGRLNDIEMSLIRLHAKVGYDILKTIEFPWPVAQIVYQHHERMDGSGYPQGLKGQDIIIEARVINVADVVEAMTYHRPYRPALGIDVAIDEITKNSGRFYDPDVVAACIRLFRDKGFEFEKDVR
jgi:PAS domain S-box-containing protein/putative nucleotidyltransferase with HDIG domain